MGEHKNPIVTVDVITETDDGGLVLIKRLTPPFVGYWAIPGGHVDPNETTEHAAIREFYEETGLKVRLQGIVGVYSSPGRDPRGRYISIVYRGKIIGGSLKNSHEGLVKVWNTVPKLMAFDHKKMLKQAGVVSA